MNGFLTMLQFNLKLLLRNKGFLCILVILPLFSVLMLNLQLGTEMETGNFDPHSVQETDIGKRLPMSMDHHQLGIMVIDADQSWLADFILQQLADSGTYRIYRFRSDIDNMEDAAAEATAYVNRNTVGAAMYIPPGLEENIRGSKPVDAVYLFKTSDDGRMTLLQESLQATTTSLAALNTATAGKPDAFRELAEDMAAKRPEKELHAFISNNDNNALTDVQANNKSNIGYALAIVSIAFLSTGIFIGSIAVDERQNLIFTRILLTGTHIASYTSIKLILSMLVTLIQVVIMGIGILLFVKVDFGLPSWHFLYFVFGAGLIFNLLSVVISAIFNNLLSASYFCFFVFTVSSLLSGLYFPLESVGELWKRAALLMPAHWVVRCCEMVMLGQSGAYSTFLLIVSGFIVIILSTGYLGIKVRQK